LLFVQFLVFCFDFCVLLGVVCCERWLFGDIYCIYRILFISKKAHFFFYFCFIAILMLLSWVVSVFLLGCVNAYIGLKEGP